MNYNPNISLGKEASLFGSEIHALLIAGRVTIDIFLATALLNMYTKFNDFTNAIKQWDTIHKCMKPTDTTHSIFFALCGEIGKFFFCLVRYLLPKYSLSNFI